MSAVKRHEWRWKIVCWIDRLGRWLQDRAFRMIPWTARKEP